VARPGLLVRHKTTKGEWTSPFAGAATPYGNGSRPPGGGLDDGIDRFGRSRVLLNTRVDGISPAPGGLFALRTTKGEVLARYVVAAPGRDGAYWFGSGPGLGSHALRAIDIGCRVEVASPVYDEITRVLYDPKFLFVTPTTETGHGPSAPTREAGFAWNPATGSVW